MPNRFLTLTAASGLWLLSVFGTAVAASEDSTATLPETLAARDFIVTPNPFTVRDPWGLQLGYRISSEVSGYVGVRVEVYDMMGDKIYASRESLLSKGLIVKPGTHKADADSPERKGELGPFVWDGHDDRGVACRNGRYLLKLILRDGGGSKEYLKKVVMLK